MHTACDCILRHASDNAMHCRSQLTIHCCIWLSTFKPCGWCGLKVSTAISCAEHQYKHNWVTHAADGGCWPRNHFMKHHHSTCRNCQCIKHSDAHALMLCTSECRTGNGVRNMVRTQFPITSPLYHHSHPTTFHSTPQTAPQKFMCLLRDRGTLEHNRNK